MRGGRRRHWGWIVGTKAGSNYPIYHPRNNATVNGDGQSRDSTVDTGDAFANWEIKFLPRNPAASGGTNRGNAYAATGWCGNEHTATSGAADPK